MHIHRLFQPLCHLNQASRKTLIARYAQPRPLETLSYATVRDFCDSADHLPEICKLHGDLKNVQRPWVIKTILSQVPLGGKLLEIGGGEPIICGILAELGYQVTLVDPYEGAGNGPTEYALYCQQYPHVKIIKDLFSPDLSGIDPASFDCIFSNSVLEHIHGETHQCIYEGIRKFLRLGGKSIHCIDHVVQGWGSEFHEDNLKQILHCQLKLQEPDYPFEQIDSDYSILMNRLKEDVETYYLSATGHYLWRGAVPYDQFPFRKVVSIQSCAVMM
ncbi:hypothetical protein DSECCO2_293700 [anaerobic digester metagenome]